MNIFSFVKDTISILEIIQTYTTLKKAGLYWKGHCPFHHEKTASFTVSPHKGIFYCFGCHAHGDVIAFIAKIENYSALEAAYFLSDRYQLKLPDTISQSQNSQELKQYYTVCEHIAQWCHKQLFKASTVQRYLNKRNITHDVIKRFLLGYLPGSQETIKTLLYDMQQQSILIDDIIATHFISKRNSSFYSPFEDRIIFPIRDHLGRFCGFGGRIFNIHDTRVKYYNSSDSDYFNKGKLLFGLDQAKKEIQKTGVVYLVEGYTDCIAMVEYGYHNTVATLGTAFTSNHLEQIARYAQEVIVVYDADHAGQKAVLRLAELCWNASLDLKVISLPNEEDPASFLLKDNLQPYIKSAKDIFDFFIDMVSNNFDKKPLSSKLNIAKKIIHIINRIEDPVKKSILLKTASYKLEIPFNALIANSATTKPNRSSLPSNQITSKEQSDVLIEQLSKKIFYAIIQDNSLLQGYHIDYLHIILLEPFGALLRLLKELQDKQNIPVTFTCFFDKLSDIDQKIVSRTLLEIEQEPSPETFVVLVAKLHKAQWKSTVQTIKNKLTLAQHNNDQQEISLLLKELLVFKKKMAGKKNITIG